MRFLIFSAASLAALLLCSSCSVVKKGTSQLDRQVRTIVEGEPEVPQGPKPFSKRERYVGDVTLVNTRGNFVLIRSTRGTAVPDGVEFFATDTSGRRTAKLRLSPERKSSFYVADILQGTPLKGHRVIMEGIVNEAGVVVWGEPSTDDATEDERQYLE